ncbi:cytochrome P450 [Glonium stellatum]|uniref:Cytochrome P450 n=1 Tax=Glonium stellatum TaxID=574774 RepID=A0A8E2F4Q6_9PEZI|nr:cytochrome P450 [Glonium stellatum]
MIDTAGVLLALAPLLLWYLYREAKYQRFKKYTHIPHLTPSLILGHMKTIDDFYKIGDRRRHIDYVFCQMAKAAGSPPVMLLDLRPVSYGVCIVFSHDVAEQISRPSKRFPYSTPKSPTFNEVLPIVGSHAIIRQEGEAWKQLRKKYNAGFAPQHLITLISSMLDKTAAFLNHLDTYAKSGAEFELDTLCTNLAFDIIGTVVMDVDLGAQRPPSQRSTIVTHFHALMQTFTDQAAIWIWFNPLLLLRRHRLSRLTNAAIKAAIAQKHAEAQTSPHASAARSVLARSLPATPTLTPAALQQTADQVKTFLFAGHDTMAILLQRLFYELSISPRVLAALRAELDDIFGPCADPAHVAAVFRDRAEDVLKRMTYASAACVDGMVLYLCHYGIQRDPGVYGDSADDFVPERWLGDSDTSAETEGRARAEGKLPASAWRPFERGPRNCIGQELANLEARVILASVARRYDFVKVGAGEVRLGEKGEPVLNEKGQYEVKSELFNTRQVTAKPYDCCRMRVKFHEN